MFWLMICAFVFLPFVSGHDTSDDRDNFNVAEQLVHERLVFAQIMSISIFVLGLVGIGWNYVHKRRRSRNLIPLVVLVVLWCFTVLTGYSYYYFLTTASETEGITVCEQGQCFWAGHIHAIITIDVCGERLDLPLEEGALDQTHTHKEKNRLHFHERLSVDPETLQITDYDPLRLKHLFGVWGVRFDSTCIADKCNGDLCDGVSGTLRMTVNGVPSAEFENYVWKEGDEIKIEFI